MTPNQLLVLLLLIPLFSFSQGATHKMTLLDGKLELTIPNQLSTMSDEDFHQHFREGASKPRFLLTDSTFEVTFAAIPTTVSLKDDDMASFALFQYQDVRKQHPNTEFPPHAHGTLMVNGKKIGYLKFIPHSPSRTGFTSSFYVLVDGKVLVLSLICPQTMQKTWEPIADKIIQTLRIK